MSNLSIPVFQLVDAFIELFEPDDEHVKMCFEELIDALMFNVVLDSEKANHKRLLDLQQHIYQCNGTLGCEAFRALELDLYKSLGEMKRAALLAGMCGQVSYAAASEEARQLRATVLEESRRHFLALTPPAGREAWEEYYKVVSIERDEQLEELFLTGKNFRYAFQEIFNV